MIEQEITVQLSDDPFDTKTIKVKVPKGTKLMCTEMYAAEAMAMYDLPDEEIKKLTLSEESNNYITQGEIVSIKTRKEIIDGEEVDVKVEALVDISKKNTAICILNKEAKEIVDQLEVGMSVDIKVKSYKQGTLYASISDAMDEVKRNEIYNAIGDKGIGFKGKVKELIHGGYFLDIQGIEVFMPGSLGGVNKLIDFERLLGKEIYVVPINYSKEKNYIVVSHRAYLRSLIPQAMDDISSGDEFTGFITGTTKFGVFVEFNQCLTGLIHKSDLDEDALSKFHSREMKPGDEITFRVKEVTHNDRIILTQKEIVIAYDPWSDIKSKYKIPSEVTGTVRKKTRYGLFVELEPKIVGLLHVSDIPEFIDINTIDEGNEITLKLIKIDKESKKVFFKI